MEEGYNNSEIEDKLFPSKITLNSRGKLLLLEEPWVMGIMNMTPDSFYPNSRVNQDTDIILKKATEMVSAGAKVLDIGGYSSRPGAKEVSAEEELNRVIPVINSIR